MIRSLSIRLDRGEDSPVAMTYILVKDSYKAFPTSRLKETRDREQDSVQHSIGECDVPVAEFLLLGCKTLRALD